MMSLPAPCYGEPVLAAWWTQRHRGTTGVDR